MAAYRDLIGANVGLCVTFCLNSEICWISIHLSCEITAALEIDLQQEEYVAKRNISWFLISRSLLLENFPQREALTPYHRTANLHKENKPDATAAAVVAVKGEDYREVLRLPVSFLVDWKRKMWKHLRYLTFCEGAHLTSSNSTLQGKNWKSNQSLYLKSFFYPKSSQAPALTPRDFPLMSRACSRTA